MSNAPAAAATGAGGAASRAYVGRPFQAQLEMAHSVQSPAAGRRDRTGTEVGEKRRRELSPRNEEEPGSRRVLKIYTVVEKPGMDKGIWLEIGVASENRDGSISGKLDCLPVNGSIQVRQWEPRRYDNGEKRRAEENAARGGFNQPLFRR